MKKGTTFERRRPLWKKKELVPELKSIFTNSADLNLEKHENVCPRLVNSTKVPIWRWGVARKLTALF
jgi:hypothetical protein